MADEKAGHSLASIGEFLKQLYVVGGIPLVLIGIGAGNMFASYGEAQRWLLSGVLIGIGTLAWCATVYVALLRWKTQAQILAQQEAQVLTAVCGIAISEKSDVAPDKIKALRVALQDMGLKSLAAQDRQSAAPTENRLEGGSGSPNSAAAAGQRASLLGR